jgi:hypothetical protein
MFQVRAQTLLGVKFAANYLNILTSIFISYPSIRTYIVLFSGTDIKESAGSRISLMRKKCFLCGCFYEFFKYFTMICGGNGGIIKIGQK